jgi:hypothetical protein
MKRFLMRAPSNRTLDGVAAPININSNEITERLLPSRRLSAAGTGQAGSACIEKK